MSPQKFCPGQSHCARSRQAQAKGVGIALCTCMHRQPWAHLLYEGNGVDGPPLQNGLLLMHGQLGKGLHGRTHRQQHPWGRHSRCAWPRSQKEEQRAGQQHGVNALQTSFTRSLATGLHRPAHHQQPPWSGPCFEAAFRFPRPQHTYADLKFTYHAAPRQLHRWSEDLAKGRDAPIAHETCSRRL